MVIYRDIYRIVLSGPHLSSSIKIPLENAHFLSSECLLSKPTVFKVYQNKVAMGITGT